MDIREGDQGKRSCKGERRRRRSGFRPPPPPPPPPPPLPQAPTAVRGKGRAVPVRRSQPVSLCLCARHGGGPPNGVPGNGFPFGLCYGSIGLWAEINVVRCIKSYPQQKLFKRHIALLAEIYIWTKLLLAIISGILY